MKTSIIIASLALGTSFVATGCDHGTAGAFSLMSKAAALKDKAMQDPRVQGFMARAKETANGWMQQGQQAMQNFQQPPQAQGWDAPQQGWDAPQQGFDLPQAQGWDVPAQGWDTPQMPQAQGWDVPAQGWDTGYQVPQAQGFDFATHQNYMAQQAQGFSTYMNGIQAQSDRNAQAVENWTNTVIRGE